uniref:Uncharacterized protein n=2 Tax=Lutzomyia longipalpis TaxID=7200 RepID=A0A1B0EW58_LUTLO
MNVLASVPGGIFAAQPSLVHVDLSSNKLSSLPAEIFSQNPVLEIIKLQSNSLEELSMDVFGNLTRLKELDVSNNYLHKFLPSERFINMHGESSILDMSNNLLASLDLRNIRASNIIVNSNYLRQVSIGEGCRELFAKNNELADIAIGASTATLEMLQMNHNKLGDNLMSICECQNLKSVFLAHNNISNIGFCFSRAGQLKEINLSRNNLSHLDYGYFSTDFLETLDLSYNAFEVIDENVLSLFRSLEYLYLDGNHLSDFPEDLDKILPHLRLIGLSHNRFQCKKLLMLYRRWQTTNRIAFNVDEPMPTNMTNIRGNICYKEKIEQIPEENIEEEPSLNHLNGSNVAFWKELQALRKKLENSNAIVEKKENISELPEKSHLIMQATTEITSGLDFSTDAPEVINETTKNATDAKEVEDNFTATGNTTILDGIFKSLSSIEGKLRELGSLLSGRNSTTSPFQSNDDRANVRTFATISTILAVIVLILGAAILWYNYHSYFYYKKLRGHNAEALRTFQTL